MKKHRRRKEDSSKIMLQFLQFIENKIINKQVYCLSELDVKEIEGFAHLMSKYTSDDGRRR